MAFFLSITNKQSALRRLAQNSSYPMIVSIVLCVYEPALFFFGSHDCTNMYTDFSLTSRDNGSEGCNVACTENDRN